jgi:hypothetical protein
MPSCSSQANITPACLSRAGSGRHAVHAKGNVIDLQRLGRGRRWVNAILIEGQKNPSISVM